MASTDETHPPVAHDIEIDRVEAAFEKLQNAWRAVRARISTHGMLQLDEETLRELDAAEEEWLAVRANISTGS
jgi:hypothetical protein